MDFNEKQLSLLNMCVTSSCVVHGPIHGHFMGFHVNGFLFSHRSPRDFLSPSPQSQYDTKRPLRKRESR